MFMGMEFIWFMGVVEDRTTDPLKLGRCKVRCLGFHTEDKSILPTADLPWASVMQPIQSAAMQGIGETPLGVVEGTWVVGFFRDGEIAQEPIVMGTIGGIPEDERNASSEESSGSLPEEGFFDPNGVYPESPANSGHSHGESDTNRLAKADKDLEHQEFTNKKNSWDTSNLTGRVTSTPIANEPTESTTWDEPDYSTVHIPKYPKNHVKETESGHIVEFDDTDSQTRINIQHQSGTFEEIHHNGDKVTRVVGKHYEVIVSDENVLVKGSCNVTIDSNCKTYIKGNWDIQVDGNKTEVVKKNVTETYGTENTEHSHTVSVTGKRAETVTNTVTETYQDNQKTDITGTLDIDAVRIDLN
jgi:hypothetical protein